MKKRWKNNLEFFFWFSSGKAHIMLTQEILQIEMVVAYSRIFWQSKSK